MALCLCATSPSPATAQSLDDASRAALDTSYALKADHERQEGAEARLRGSIDNFMPTISVAIDDPLDSSITYRPSPLPSTVGLDAIPRSAPRQYIFRANLPLFDGFKRWNSYQSSQSLVEAGHQLTLGRRQQVLLDAAVAYLAVARDARIVELRRDQIDAVTRVETATTKQLSVNDATRTDVALTRSRVQQAEAVLERANADLAASQIEFKRLTQLDPDHVARPPMPANLPKTEEAVAAMVRAANPSLKAARLDVRSAEYLAQAAKADLLPSLDFQASHSSQYGYSPGLDRITDSTARLIARFPIYEPGAFPRIGEARAAARQRAYEVDDSELATLTSARTAFVRRKAIGAELARLKSRVEELRSAMGGFEIERGAGFRTVIDELNIHAELADAQVAATIVSTEFDALTFQLAAATGLLQVGTAAATEQPATTSGKRRTASGQTTQRAKFKPSWSLKAAISAAETAPLLRGTQPAVTAAR